MTTQLQKARWLSASPTSLFASAQAQPASCSVTTTITFWNYSLFTMLFEAYYMIFCSPWEPNRAKWWTTTCAFSYCIRWSKLFRPYPVCSQHLDFTEHISPRFVPAHCLHQETESLFVMVNMWTVKRIWFGICILPPDTVLHQDSTETSKWAGHFIRKESTRKQPGVAIPLEP